MIGFLHLGVCSISVFGEQFSDSGITGISSLASGDVLFKELTRGGGCGLGGFKQALSRNSGLASLF